MRTPALERAVWRGVALAEMLVACGPDVPAGGTSTSAGGTTLTGSSTGSGDSTTSGSSASGTSSITTTEGPTTSTTMVPQPCSEVHEGDLYVVEDTDFASLANLGRVTKTLYIFMGDREQSDLSFLPCLHTVDSGLTIQNNQFLETTEGLVNLKMLGSLSITDNPNLRVVAGFEQIEDLHLLKLTSNHSLEEIHLDSVQTVEYMSIGFCENNSPMADHLALVELAGFGGLTNVPTLIIDGNEALMSVGVLDALAINGGPAPSSVRVRFNPLLSEALVHEKLDVLGVTKRTVCGNAEGDPECFCVVGE